MPGLGELAPDVVSVAGAISRRGVRYLTAADVRAACDALDPVAAVHHALIEHAHRRSVMPHEAYLSWEAGDGSPCRSISMPAFAAGIAGTKVINANPANPARGLDRASGMILLYERDSAEVLAILAAAPVSALRTAAVTVLAARALGRRPLGRVALIGAGRLAEAHLELLLREQLGISEIAVFDTVAQRARHLCDGACCTVPVVAAASARSAIAGAGLVIPVTTTTEGYIEPGWLEPGTLLVNVSLDDPLPELVLECELLLVDDWDAVAHDRRRLLGRLHAAGRLDGPAAAPRPGVRRVDAELGDVLAGRHPGRFRPEDVVVVNPFGLAVEDIALAADAYGVGVERGLGVELAR